MVLRKLLNLPTPSPEKQRYRFVYVSVVSAAAILFGIFQLFSSWHDYRMLDNSPISLTIEQAMPSPESTPQEPRWVKLTGLTEAPCSQVIRDEGTLRYFVSDGLGQRWVLVTKLTGNGGCGPLVYPATGILKRADVASLYQLKTHNMQDPSSGYPLMEFEPGTDPSTLQLFGYYGLYLVVVGLTGLVFSLVKLSQLKKKHPPSRPEAPLKGVRSGSNRPAAMDMQKRRI